MPVAEQAKRRRRSGGGGDVAAKAGLGARMGLMDVIFSIGQCVILLIVGAIVLGNSAYYVYTDFFSANGFHAAGVIFVVMGVFRAITLMMRCFGVFSTLEKGPAIAFALLIFVSVVMFFIGGIVMLVYHGSVEDEVVGTMRRYMREYGARNADAEADVALLTWDRIQSKEMCCGINGPIDWLEFYTGGSGAAAASAISNNIGNDTDAADAADAPAADAPSDSLFLPQSCCPKPTHSQGATDCSLTFSYKTGCAVGLQTIKSMALGSGIFAVIFSIIPLVSVVLVIVALLAATDVPEDTYTRIGSKIYHKTNRAAPVGGPHQPVPTEEPKTETIGTAVGAGGGSAAQQMGPSAR